ncbi:hypothetical protein H5V43_01785 [Sphingobium fuliginis]|uniref:Uncharacterized protein n=1 Tax=Sphingobium fuliginis (strain ATCC 27551) TaxID=336203 RepID=A0A7M2GH66_SPHSA|nr:hypothetical protein [Sphingobium fuliginis]QOT71933.1 hypothetical protein H5V43_01785 [Sphingobium fuliginis]
MTAPARITQADMDRAVKSVKAAGVERARIVMDLKNQRIDIIIGDLKANADSEGPNPFDED